LFLEADLLRICDGFRGENAGDLLWTEGKKQAIVPKYNRNEIEGREQKQPTCNFALEA
jgi:hypothetical protein